MTTATQWLLNWAIAYSTPYLVNYGPGNANLQSKIFFLWGGFCFICIAFVYFMVYETKGLSLEEVDELYTDVKSARQSTSWKPTETFVDRTASVVSKSEKEVEGIHREDLSENRGEF